MLKTGGDKAPLLQNENDHTEHQAFGGKTFYRRTVNPEPDGKTMK